MTTQYYLCPISTIFQYFTDVGIPLSGGQIYTYIAGTSTPVATYTSITGGSENSNPIVLASNGRLNNVQIWIPGGSAVKIVITDSNNNQLGPIFDQISGINDPAGVIALLANPNTGFGADLVANAVKSYGLVSNLRAEGPPSVASGQTLTVSLIGLSTLADGNGGLFYWSAGSSATDDGVNVIEPTGGGSVGRYIRIPTPNQTEGLFTGTLSGMTASTTGDFFYNIYNNISTRPGLCSLYGSASGVSNTNSMALSGLPESIWPSSQRNIPCTQIINNGGNYWAEAVISTSGTINFNIIEAFSGSPSLVGSNSGLFASSGTKGIYNGWQIIYQL